MRDVPATFINNNTYLVVFATFVDPALLEHLVGKGAICPRIKPDARHTKLILK